MESEIKIPSLVVGNTYSVIDWYGTVSFDAVFLGIAKNKKYRSYDGVLVFEISERDTGSYRFCGVIPETSYSKNYKSNQVILSLYLRIKYYGSTMEDLRPQGYVPESPFILEK